MDTFVNPDNQAFQVAVNSEIYVEFSVLKIGKAENFRKHLNQYDVIQLDI